MSYITYEVRVYDNGSKAWYKDGKRHREDGHAVEGADGRKSWYKDGKLHREDGPAIETADGDKYWYKDGKRHREDGPAIEDSNGDKYWFINDVKLTEAEFKARKNTCAGKIVEVDGKKYKLVEA